MSHFKLVSKSDGLIVHQTTRGFFEWSFTHGTSTCIQRFQRLQHAAMCLDPKSPWSLPASLVCLDAIQPRSLIDIAQSGVMFRCGNDVSIEWTDQKTRTTARRCISPMTTLAVSHLSSSCQIQGEKLAEKLTEWLHSQLDPVENSADAMSAIERDQSCWLAFGTPAVLFSHLVGLTPMQVVPRSCLARHQTKKSLLNYKADGEAEALPAQADTVDSDAGATGLMVEAAWAAVGDIHNHALIQATLAILRQRHPSPIDGWSKRFWIEQLTPFISRVGRSHPAIGMCIGWVIHMAEVGTVESPNPSLTTIRAYSNSALKKLSESLIVMPTDPELWATEQLIPLYLTLISTCSGSSRGHLVSAISNFHAYLVEWLDIEPLQHRLGKLEITKQIRANLLWEHEVDLAIQWANEWPEKRLGKIAACMLAIASEQAVRIQDLRRINLKNVAFHNGISGTYVTIEIVRNARRGRLKTENAQRRIQIVNPVAVQCIHDWREQRKAECAPAHALFFGDLSNDSLLYKPGEVHALLNRLLKSATGDPSIRFHSLRHTAISRQVNKILLTSSLVDVHPFEELANQCGHGTPQTTLQTYSHLHEQATRMWLDLAISRTMYLTGAEAENITKIKQNTLTVTARRRRISRFDLTHAILTSMAEQVPIEDVSLPFQWVFPIPPTSPHSCQKSLTPAVVADVLLRLGSDTPAHRLAAMMGASQNDFDIWLTKFKQYLVERLGVQHPRSPTCASMTDIPQLLARMNAKLDWLFRERTKSMLDYMSGEVDHGLLARSIQAFEKCSRGKYIALTDPSSARQLFIFMRLIGLNPRCPRIVIQSGALQQDSEKDQTNPDHPITSLALRQTAAMATGVPINNSIKGQSPTTLHQHKLHTHQILIEEVFSQEFGLKPVTEKTARRVDRPDFYLVINPNPQSAATPSANGITPALQGWLIVCKAYLMIFGILAGGK